MLKRKALKGSLVEIPDNPDDTNDLGMMHEGVNALDIIHEAGESVLSSANQSTVSDDTVGNPQQESDNVACEPNNNDTQISKEPDVGRWEIDDTETPHAHEPNVTNGTSIDANKNNALLINVMSSKDDQFTPPPLEVDTASDIFSSQPTSSVVIADHRYYEENLFSPFPCGSSITKNVNERQTTKLPEFSQRGNEKTTSNLSLQTENIAMSSAPMSVFRRSVSEPTLNTKIDSTITLQPGTTIMQSAPESVSSRPTVELILNSMQINPEVPCVGPIAEYLTGNACLTSKRNQCKALTITSEPVTAPAVQKPSTSTAELITLSPRNPDLSQESFLLEIQEIHEKALASSPRVQTTTAHKPCASKGTSVSTNMATQTGPVAIPDPPVKRSEFSAQMEYMDRALTDHERRMRTAEILRDSQEKKVDKNNAELFMLYSEMRDAHNGMLSDINDLKKVLSDLMMVTPNFENLIVRQGAPTDSSVRASDNVNQRRMPDQTCTAMPNTSYANPTPAPIMRPDGFSDDVRYATPIKYSDDKWGLLPILRALWSHCNALPATIARQPTTAE